MYRYNVSIYIFCRFGTENCCSKRARDVGVCVRIKGVPIEVCRSLIIAMASPRPGYNGV